MEEVLRAIELPVGTQEDGSDRDCVLESAFDAPGVRDIEAAYRIAAVGGVFRPRNPLSLAGKT